MLGFRSRWANSSPAVRRGTVGVLYALLTSFVLVGLAYLAIWWLHPDSAIASWDRFAVFMDALLAGVVAFAMLGAFTFVASLRKPEEDAIGDRIAYLYSARLDESHATKRYLTDQLMLLGATVRDSRSLYNFMQIDAGNQAVRVNVRISMTIANMMKRDTYRQDMPVRVSFDGVPGHEDNMGAMLRVETTPCQRDGRFDGKVNHLEQSCLLVEQNGKYRYESKVELTIPPHGELRYEYEYEGWVKTEDIFWTGVNRFAEVLTVEVVNVTTKPLEISPHPDPKRQQFINIDSTHVLSPGDSGIIFVAKEVPPNCPVTFSTKF